jgi:hypothetical protein
VLFALVVLGAGLCLFDHNDDGLDGHGMPQDLCCVMLVVPAVTLTLSRLVPRGLVVTLTRAELIAVPLSVLDPPPRRSLLA